MKYISTIHPSRRRGYTLLFAVLTASLVLGVAVFILSVSRKQYALSVTARESTYSIYAADSGIECASNITSLATSTPNASGKGGVMSCNGSGDVDIPAFDCDDFDSTKTISGRDFTNVCESESALIIPLENDTCVALTFITGFDIDRDRPATLIESRGYNVCKIVDGEYGPDVDSPRIVERALRLTQGAVW